MKILKAFYRPKTLGGMITAAFYVAIATLVIPDLISDKSDLNVFVGMALLIVCIYVFLCLLMMFFETRIKK